MSAHTPGPWVVVERETLDDGSVYPRHIIGGARELVVCYLESEFVAQQVDDSDAMFEAVGDMRSKAANARLISAAPDMLEALEEINGCIEWSDHAQKWVLLGRFRTQPALEKVRAAIAKAKGKT